MSSTATFATLSMESRIDEAPRACGLLQRKCACGGGTGTSGECAECKKKKLLQRREAGSVTPSAVPSIVHDVLNSPGQPLDSSTRSFMEPRFSRDFGNIRIHNGSRAAASARAVNANAWTVGDHVVFAPGKYDPHSTTGRHLLAHELAHTLQQSGLQRSSSGVEMARGHEEARLEAEADRVAAAVVGGQPAIQHLSVSGVKLSRQVPPVATPPAAAPPADLEIDGKSTSSSFINGNAVIFFDRNSSSGLTLDDEIAVMLVTGPPIQTRPLKIRGYVSLDEGGNTAAGQALARARIATVRAEVHSTYTGAITEEVRADIGECRADYREVRVVELIENGAASSYPDCGASGNAPCAGTDESNFTDAATDAETKIDQTITDLAASPIDSGLSALLDRFFGAGAAGVGVPVASTVKTKLGLIRSQFTHNRAAVGHRCGTLSDSTCSIAIAYNEGVGSASTLTLCPGFNRLSRSERARNAIHEVAHGTTGITLSGGGTTDVSYRHERIFPRLPTADALRNSDSYALLVLAWTTPSYRFPVPPTDTFTGFVSTTDSDQVRDGIGIAERWLKWSTQELSGIYDSIVEGRPTTTWANGYYRESMRRIAPRFSLRVPTSVSVFPSLSEQVAVAGIADRYDTLKSKVARANLSLVNAPPTPPVTTSVTTFLVGTYSIGTDFFASSAANQPKVLIKALIAAESTISSSLKRPFLEATEILNSRHP